LKFRQTQLTMLTLHEDKVQQHYKCCSNFQYFTYILFHKLSSISWCVTASNEFRRRVIVSMAVKEKYIEKRLRVMKLLNG